MLRIATANGLSAVLAVAAAIAASVLVALALPSHPATLAESHAHAGWLCPCSEGPAKTDLEAEARGDQSG